ncbi:hypothetical protein T05_590 [Trichinella murrelli]|uniref:Uncharacterized protein n=1 Tax=Trichinella murrelli TaxID=144512 RepID=A0A0V0T6V4_9BILA|nr:hypothetical protein T05_590 [Trichinella murrelli]
MNSEGKNKETMNKHAYLLSSANARVVRNFYDATDALSNQRSPMYRLAEVEVAALYPRIREVALNRGYQGCFKITNYCLWIEIDPKAAALFIKAWKINPYVPISLPVHQQ